MAKFRRFYECSKCGAQAPKWAGQCGECGSWNTLVESVAESPAAVPAKGNAGYAGAAGAAAIQPLADVELAEISRTSTLIAELDRVLGGGLVQGSVILIGGDPGIGKSTLLSQMVALQTASADRPLYVTGEESAQQVRLRAERLGLDSSHVNLLTETSVERIISAAKKNRPGLMVVDSIQTTWTEALQSAPGSVAQVRESAAQLVRFAKTQGVTVFLVGHVTKEGALAGPRVLEHMVDTVLYFEGDSGSRYRIVRAVKNRFGAVNELGMFAMTEAGLKEVSNPSAIFLSRQEDDVAGSIVMVTREGLRPLLVEVQALVDSSPLSNPRRVTLGLDQNRLAMLLAVLHRHGDIAIHDQDVFVNVVGGVRITETAADLPLLLAVMSSLRDRALPRDLIAFGEVGLSGELRPVSNGPERLHEAIKHGFKRAIVPKANARNLGDMAIEVIPVSNVAQALQSTL